MRTALNQAALVCLCIVRNCERTVIDNLQRLQKSFDAARTLDWHILESDSIDGTLKTLQDYAQTHPEIRVHTLCSLEAQIPHRPERLAHCRTYLKEQITPALEKNVYDYVVVADLDGMQSLLTREAVEQNWTLEVDWDVVTANQRGHYYDIWALRHPLWCPSDCWEEAGFYQSLGMDRKRARFYAVDRKMHAIPETAAPIEVESAFGGTAIYKAQAYRAGTYKGICDGKGLCEHVPFHEAIRQAGGKIYLNPGFVNARRSRAWSAFNLLNRLPLAQ